MTKKVFLVGLLLVGRVFGAYPITGSFLNFERGLSDGGWAYELDQMKGVGNDTIQILSAGQFSGSDQGTTCSASDAAVLYSGGQLGGAVDKIGLVMNFAQARGIQVWVGSLQTSGAWNSPHLDACNRQVVQDLSARFPGSVFAGVYMPQEIWLNPYQSPTSEAVSALYNLVASVHAVAPGKRVLVAPYFKKDTIGQTPGVSASEAASILKMVIESTGVDVVAPQTGVGAQAGAPPLSETGSYFAAMKAVLPAGTELWADVETFQFSALVATQDKYPPASISSVVGQVNAVQPYVTKIVSWMFGRDMSPQAVYYPIQASQLLMDYQSVYGGIVKYPLIPFTYTYEFQPSSRFPDNGSMLNDRVGGGYGGQDVDWVGHLDSDDAYAYYLNLNLSQAVRVRKIRILFKNQMDSWIAWPYQVLGNQMSFGFEAWFMQMGPFQVPPPNPNSQTFAIGWAEWKESPNNSCIPNAPCLVIPPVITNSLRIRIAHVGWSHIAEVEVYGEPVQ